MAMTDAPKKTATVGNKGRIGAYLTPDEAERVRGAYQFGWLQDNSGSLSDFVKSLVLAEVERLENELNGGEEFPSVKAGAVRTVAMQQIADKRQPKS
ncbi:MULTISPECIES: ParB family protein [Nocardia]|uniref:ParB family protein n=1 Tax=Nocardia TaxID=1817 RepID=UPI00245621EA|nr:MULTISPECIES: hypothetical protein [Nocardia]